MKLLQRPTLVSRSLCHGGSVEFYKHLSIVCDTEMRFSVFIPPQAEHKKVPTLMWLSGLTCTEENFMVKSGAQAPASERGLMLVVPDTSPRLAGIPGEADSWDFGLGAGYYVNATESPWSKHYQMYDYVTRELPDLIRTFFPAREGTESISGHSMGGHGALVAALRQPGRYRSVSAFAPICAPSQVEWGEKAFSRFLGSNRAAWQAYDTCSLLANTETVPSIFVDQGMEDKFLAKDLRPDLLKKVIDERGLPIHLRMQPGYDHSYYFVSTFIKDHIYYHADRLG